MTPQKLAAVLVETGLIQALAIEDKAGYDNYKTWDAIARAAQLLTYCDRCEELESAMSSLYEIAKEGADFGITKTHDDLAKWKRNQKLWQPF